MKNIYLVIILLAVFASAAFGMSCHTDTSGASQTMQEKSAAVDAGNKICPVLGNPIDDATKATYEYEGKIYNFCCRGCIGKFKKEPQKYIDKVNQELQANQNTK